ncbi:outer membrane protein [Brucellaceae bacterium C25G]
MTKMRIMMMSLSAAILAAPAAVHAADYVNNDYSYDTPSSASSDWSGNYVGAQIGATSSKTPSPFSSRSGVLMGAVAGKNIQTGNFVFGGEVELNFGEAEHKIGNGGRLQQSWNAAAKAKAGYAMDRTLVYGTLGYGTTKFKPKGDTTKGPGWEGGVLIGAGVEQKLTGPLSVKAEYDYMRFSNVKSNVNGVRQTNKLHNHMLKAGLNYNF